MRLRVSMLAALLLTSCGYTVGIDTFGSGVRRVAVQVADNRTYRQDFEVGLTRSLHEQLTVHTDLRPSPLASADAVLRVSIETIRNEALVRDGTPVREGSIDFVAVVILEDRETGRTLSASQVLDRGEFRIPVGESAASATNEALTDLARKIVLALEGEF